MVNNVLVKLACLEEAEIDRTHYIGKSYKNESSGLTVKPISIKFKSWRYRQDVYRNQQKKFENDKSNQR